MKRGPRRCCRYWKLSAHAPKCGNSISRRCSIIRSASASSNWQSERKFSHEEELDCASHRHCRRDRCGILDLESTTANRSGCCTSGHRVERHCSFSDGTTMAHSSEACLG